MAALRRGLPGAMIAPGVAVAVAVFGAAGMRTPNLDGLARQRARFTNFYAAVRCALRSRGAGRGPTGWEEASCVKQHS